MSRLTLLLLLSGSINVFALIAWTVRSAPVAPPTTTDAPTTSPAVDPNNVAAPPATWADLSPADSAKLATPALPDAAFVARLRAAGFSTDVIRAILRQQVDDHFAEREAAIRAAHPPAPYWDRRYGTNTTHRDSGPERIALRNEKRALLRALLGDAAETPDEKARRQRDYGSIPVEKVEQLIQLNTDYDDLHNDLRNQFRGLVLPSDREALAAIKTERRAAIAELLTPDELATYDLHSGDTATDLRTKLRWFRPTENEFLALYTLQADLEAAHPLPSIVSGDMLAEVQALRAQRAVASTDYEIDIAALLGPERFAEYQLVASPAYKQMRELTDRLNLPAESAADLTRSFNTFTADAQHLLSASAGNPAEQANQIQALRATLVGQLSPDLPDEARAAFDFALQGRIRSRVATPRPAPAPRP